MAASADLLVADRFLESAFTPTTTILNTTATTTIAELTIGASSTVTTAATASGKAA
jgi:hypothetical protein